jgi:hypothetical protein
LDVVEGKGRNGWWRRSVRPDARSITRASAAPQVIFAEYDRGVRTLAVALGALLALAGLVWVAQGLNLPFAPRSFMTDDRTWILLGAVATLAGVSLVAWGRARPRGET